MALSRLKIGDIITVCDERNRNGENYPFYGINISKEFMPSVANTQNVDKTKYKIVRYKRFVFLVCKPEETIAYVSACMQSIIQSWYPLPIQPLK